MTTFLSNLSKLWYCVTGSLLAEIATNQLVSLGLYSKKFFDGDLTGKVIIVTGGNRGIGKSIVEQLARKGAKVIIACRNVKAGEEVVSKITSKHPAADVSVAELDLLSFKSIKNFADQIIANELKVDVLVNNAVLIKYNHEETAEGLEVQSAVALYGPLVLTLLLLPKLINSNGSVVNVSSMFHRNVASINIKDLNMKKKEGYDFLITYSELKVLMHLWTKYLGKKLASNNNNNKNNNNKVSLVCVDPGCAQTDIVAQGPASAQTFFNWKIFTPLFRTVDDAAGSIVQSIFKCKDGYEGGVKFHMKDGYFVEPSKVSSDENLSHQLWQVVLPVVKEVVDMKILEEYSLLE